MRACRACGHAEHGLDRCEVAARKRRGVVANVNPMVANTVADVAPREVPPEMARAYDEAFKASRHGKYADLEARKTYQRELMRKRRAGKPEFRNFAMALDFHDKP